MSSQSTTDSTRTGCTPGGKELLVSSTIDFLDCAFFCHDGPEDYYPQEEYEKLIRSMAEGGIRKIYFRANICGLTHYPTAVSRQYGRDYAYHYAFRKQAQWLMETYRRYNPCLETIRLGHKYGLEVWGWESLYDDAGLKYGTQDLTAAERKTFEHLDGWVLLDPWYVDNMDAFAAHVSNLETLKNAESLCDALIYHYGMAEFTVPKTMEHKVARFEELAAYPFDGFMFNTRCHSASGDGKNYGYNPEVMAIFEQRNGRAFTGSDEDIATVFQIRAESIAEFFRRCKALSGGRPIFFSAPMPPEMRDDPCYNDTFGPMPWPYTQMFREGSLDGVMMIGKNFRNGTDFSGYFTHEVTGGRPIKVGIFRELGDDCPKDYDLQQELGEFRAAGRLDEMELYESYRFHLNPEALDVIRGTAPEGFKIQWKPM